MEGILKSIRTGILLGVKTLPLILISFIGFMAAGLANAGLFILFIGQITVLPLAVAMSQAFFGMIAGDQTTSPFHVRLTNVSLIVPSSTTTDLYQNVAPSYWMAQMIFFFSYAITNAAEIYKLPEDKRLEKSLIENRKTKAVSIIVAISIIAVGLTIFRYSTHTETVMGIMLALVLGGGLGHLWYHFAAQCGVVASDVFGMVQQIIPFTEKDTKSMMCVYNPK